MLLSVKSGPVFQPCFPFCPGNPFQPAVKRCFPFCPVDNTPPEPASQPTPKPRPPTKPTPTPSPPPPTEPTPSSAPVGGDRICECQKPDMCDLPGGRCLVDCRADCNDITGEGGDCYSTLACDKTNLLFEID